jgi:hypothetical protein
MVINTTPEVPTDPGVNRNQSTAQHNELNSSKERRGIGSSSASKRQPYVPFAPIPVSLG